MALKLGGGSGGGGRRGRPPAPPPPLGVGLPSIVSDVPPQGILVPRGLPGGRGRRVRPGRPPSGQCGGGGGGGGNPPALVRAPVFLGPASEGAAPFAPSWAPPVRRAPAAGRACWRLPRPWCPLRPAAAASSGGVQGRCLFGLPPSALGPEGEGGGEWGGPSGPLAPPPDGRGGAAWRSRPRGRAVGWGVALFPRPPLPRVAPSCRPSLGPPVPSPSSPGAGGPRAAVRVSGQRLAGCGAVGSPPRLLSRPSLPREVACAPPSRRIGGGGVCRGAQLLPPLSRVCRLGRHLRRRLSGGWGCGGGGLRRR